MLRQVEKAPFEHLVVLPFTPFLAFEEGREKEELREFFDLARAQRATLVLGLSEKARDGQVYYSSLILSPRGQILGKYRKSHRLAWDDGEFALGNDLPVFETAFGKIGLTISSYFYFP